MPKATSSLETDRASRYLQAMFRHFAHKVPVSYDATKGSAEMPYGHLSMRVADNLLHFEIVAENDQLLDRLKYAVEAHIVRFAFREKLQKLDWQ